MVIFFKKDQFAFLRKIKGMYLLPSEKNFKLSIMKKLVLILTGIMFSTAALLAQTPVPESDTLKDPVKQTDPEVKVLPQDANYLKDHVKITPKQIPAGVKQMLESSPEYTGWEKAAFYKDKAGTKFTVQITRGDTTRIFHFDPTGKPLIE
jgi:hypothetical protein